MGKAMDLNVRKDATVEEVIGFSLWTYWKEGWLPKLDEGLSGEDDPKWETKVSAVGWIMRIAEEDGEVDDDFPRMLARFLCDLISHDSSAPDRLGKVSKFNADAYAVLEATPTQGKATSLHCVRRTYKPNLCSQFNRISYLRRKFSASLQGLQRRQKGSLFLVPVFLRQARAVLYLGQPWALSRCQHLWDRRQVMAHRSSFAYG